MASFLAVDRTPIVFDDWAGTGGGVPVVLHHGFAADTASNWERPGVVDALRATGRRVVSIDARGHGRSGKPHDPAAYAAPAMARDLVALFDHLGLDQVDLIGYSMGGFVSIETATRDSRLRSLVLGGIGAGALPGRGTVGPPIDHAATAEALEADDPATAPKAGRGFRRLADATGQDRLALAAVLRAGAHDTGDLEAIRCPVLVLAGDADPLTAGVDELVAALPTSRFVELPGDHLSVVGSPAFIAAIVEFLDQQ